MPSCTSNYISEPTRWYMLLVSGVETTPQSVLSFVSIWIFIGDQLNDELCASPRSSLRTLLEFCDITLHRVHVMCQVNHSLVSR